MRKFLAILIVCVCGAASSGGPPPNDDPPQFDGGVAFASFSPDGKFLATYTYPSNGKVSNVLRLWDLSKEQGAKGEQKALVWKIVPDKIPRKGSSSVLRAMSFSPDGKQILAVIGYHGSEETELFKFAVADGKLVKTHALGKLWRFAFSPDGGVLVGVLRDETRQWATGDFKLKGRIPAGGFQDFRVSPDGNRFLVWLFRDGLEEYAFSTGKMARRFKYNTARAFAADYLKGYDAILIRAGTDTCHLLDTDSGLLKPIPKSVRSMKRHDRLVFSPNGKYVARVAKDGEASIYDLASGKDLHRLPRAYVLEEKSYGKLVRQQAVVQFSPDGKQLLVAGISWGPKDESEREDFIFGDRTGILLFDAEGHKTTRTITFPLRSE